MEKRQFPGLLILLNGASIREALGFYNVVYMFHGKVVRIGKTFKLGGMKK